MEHRNSWPEIFAALMTLTGLTVALWLEMPEWQRQAMVTRTRARVRQASDRAARAAGRRAMGDELAGRRRDAGQGYALAYRLSTWRDRL